MSKFCLKVYNKNNNAKTYCYDYGTKKIWMKIGKRTSMKKNVRSVVFMFESDDYASGMGLVRYVNGEVRNLNKY